MASSVSGGSKTKDTAIEIRRKYLIDNMEPNEIAQELNLSLVYIEKCIKNIKRPKRSSGEVSLKEILVGIYGHSHVIEQKPFNGLYLDFFIPRLRLAFEFDGQFHFTHSKFAHGEGIKGMYNFDHAVANDNKKNQLCKKEHIYLIRIPFTFKLTEQNIRNLIDEHHQHIVANLVAYDPEVRVESKKL
jgi:hypothetical protein